MVHLQLHDRIDEPSDLGGREEVPGHVEHDAPVRETGAVADAQRRDRQRIACALDRNELTQGLHAPEGAGSRGRADADSFGGDLQGVALVGRTVGRLVRCDHDGDVAVDGRLVHHRQLTPAVGRELGAQQSRDIIGPLAGDADARARGKDERRTVEGDEGRRAGHDHVDSFS